MPVADGLALAIRLRFHNHAPQQPAIRLSLHQQAADELGGDLLGAAAEEGLGEVLGKRGGFGSGLGDGQSYSQIYRVPPVAMGKKYLVVEEDNSAAGCLGLAAVLAVIYFILSYAHILLAGGLGFCGFLIGKHIIESNPVYKWQHKTCIYLASMLLLGGFGFWGGREISDHFRKSVDSPPEETKPANKEDGNTKSFESAPTRTMQPKTPITKSETVNLPDEKITPKENQKPEPEAKPLESNDNPNPSIDPSNQQQTDSQEQKSSNTTEF